MVMVDVAALYGDGGYMVMEDVAALVMDDVAALCGDGGCSCSLW